jgi:hypothetical protein
MTLNAFDWAIIVVYLIGMIGLSFYLARGQKSGRDYYLGAVLSDPCAIRCRDSGIVGFSDVQVTATGVLE